MMVVPVRGGSDGWLGAGERERVRLLVHAAVPSVLSFANTLTTNLQ